MIFLIQSVTNIEGQTADILGAQERRMMSPFFKMLLLYGKKTHTNLCAVNSS